MVGAVAIIRRGAAPLVMRSRLRDGSAPKIWLRTRFVDEPALITNAIVRGAGWRQGEAREVINVAINAKKDRSEE